MERPVKAVARSPGRPDDRDQGSQNPGANSLFALFMLSIFCASGSAHEIKMSRTEDDRPDLNGIWQTIGTAHWNLEAHSATPGLIKEAGAFGAAPAGPSVIASGNIPYRDKAAALQKANYRNRAHLDPAIKCYMPGVPRATYMPFPFQIVQTPDYIFMAYSFAGASRTIFMNQPDLKAPVNTWMGHSRGHWEGDTLVIEVTDQVADTWLDRAGNYHSDQLKVTERYTRKGEDHIIYEATISDTSVYSEPWTIRLPLYRRIEDNAQLVEFRCVEFAEELLYGDLTRKSGESK